jgi:hypothetical protein
MIAMSTAKGMGPALITNGWLLPKLDALARSGEGGVHLDRQRVGRRCETIGA